METHNNASFTFKCQHEVALITSNFMIQNVVIKNHIFYHLIQTCKRMSFFAILIGTD